MIREPAGSVRTTTLGCLAAQCMRMHSLQRANCGQGGFGLAFSRVTRASDRRMSRIDSRPERALQPSSVSYGRLHRTREGSHQDLGRRCTSGYFLLVSASRVWTIDRRVSLVHNGHVLLSHARESRPYYDSTQSDRIAHTSPTVGERAGEIAKRTRSYPHFPLSCQCRPPLGTISSTVSTCGAPAVASPLMAGKRKRHCRSQNRTNNGHHSD